MRAVMGKAGGLALIALLLGASPAALLRAQPEAAYRRAVEAALNPTPGDACDCLWPIAPGNERLRWKDSRVLVTAWTQRRFYEGREGEAYDTGEHEIWVTPAPQVKEICSQADFASGIGLRQRLQRLLGLPPEDPPSDRVFVEFWVSPHQLFRPCPDLEVHDRSCSLAFPESVSPWHRRWINELRSKQYFHAPCMDPDRCPGSEKKAYPWTQFGYTYDWHYPPADERRRGPSEFVLHKYSKIVVSRIVEAEEYCRQ